MFPITPISLNGRGFWLASITFLIIAATTIPIKYAGNLIPYFSNIMLIVAPIPIAIPTYTTAENKLSSVISDSLFNRELSKPALPSVGFKLFFIISLLAIGPPIRHPEINP